MAKGTAGGGEHRVRIPARGGGADHQQAGEGAKKPERQLNVFVRVVTLVERLGNALGTLAFTWATVVLLGGYPTVLRGEDDFWFATIIVFLEAGRMFSRNNRLDYQLFFQTKGAVRALGSNGLIVIVYLSSALTMFLLVGPKNVPRGLAVLTVMLLLVIPAAFGLFQSSGALNYLLSKPVRHAVSLCSPLVAILLLIPFLLGFNHRSRNTMAKGILFTLLFSTVLLLTMSRLRLPRITRLVNHALGSSSSRQVFWRRLVLNICMFVEPAMLVYMPHNPFDKAQVLTYSLYALVLVSFGNLQIPAAIVRVSLSILRLVPQDYVDSGKEDSGKEVDNAAAKINLSPSMTIFYVMVLGQGILYIVACLLEIFSFIPRRTLARRGGFRGQWGVQSVNLYYAYALEKCMENDVLASKKISLGSFAMDSINSDSPKKQLHGIQMVHDLLRREPSRTRLLSKLNASWKTMDRIIKMLDWTRPEDSAVRLFAAKVIAELAKSLRVVSMVPGFMQIVSSLLDADTKLEREHALLDTDDEQDTKQDAVADVTYIVQDERDGLAMDADGKLGQRQNPLWDASSLVESEARSTHQVGMNGQNSFFLRCWKWILRFWGSTPQEDLAVDHDHLPALGMSILDSLCCDQDNCLEMTRVAGLIPKIIGFTSYKSYAKNTNEVQQKIMLQSSLKLLKSLSKTGGQIGITLRHKISEHPLLLRNLAEILDDRFSSRVRKLVIGILRNLALDANTSEEIGSIQVIIGRLMDAFLNPSKPSSKNPNRFLQKVAGQALAMLAVESPDNCEAMLREAGNVIGELASMICESNNRYVAARLLLNLFQHMKTELSNLDLRKLCETLPKVLDTILDAQTEGAELEVLIGLSAQICKVVPEDFAREIENGHRKEIFVRRVVDVLKANMNPAAHCPGIRRVVIEQAIYLITCSSAYANVFNQYGMMEALLMVERTPSRVERYRIFLGDAGFMEHKEPLTDLVGAAKELLCRQWVKDISNVNRQGM